MDALDSLAQAGAHPQTWVKVNAPVDIGIAPLVALLSQIEGLETLESCQDQVGTSWAFVLFRYGAWQQCGEFLFNQIQPTIPPALCADVSLSVESLGQHETRAHIGLRPNAVPQLVESIRPLVERLSGRRSACCGGR